MEPTRRLLFIDDDAGLCRLATRALGKRGFDVACATGGAEGIAMARAERFELVTVDHYMPGLDGLATLERLRELDNPPGIVYVTGSEESRIAVAALRAGADDYVVKTIGEDFFDLLAAALGSVRERSALARDKARAEADLRASNARLEALLGEVNHRVANSLQIVSAMVRLQASALTDGQARGALDDTGRRIDAIAQVHRRLYTSSEVESVDMAEYLRALIAELGETLSSPAAPRRIHLAAAPIRLATDRAVSLGVIVTELVTNSCKYAYPTGGGEVRVRLDHAGANSGTVDGFELVVEDDGCGMPDSASPRGTGLGQKLIRAMANSLQASFAYDPGYTGVRATLRAGLV